MKTFFLTDKGKVRQHNEDCADVFMNENGDRLAIVADGMGGHRAGDIASSMAITYFGKVFKDAKALLTPKEAEEWLHQEVSTINTLVFEHSEENLECQGMGTTIVVAICTQQFTTIGHIGDSRCYFFSSGEVTQVTEDHSLVNELVRSGQISKDDAEVHPRRNVLVRALGTDAKVTLDVRTLAWEIGDCLILCSDGLSNKVSLEDLQEIMKSPFTIDERGKNLVGLANDFGGEDNITIALVEYVASLDERG